MTRTATLLLVLCALLGPASAGLAQPLEFPVDNFRPAPSAKGYYVTENGTVLGHLQPSFILYGSYASRPLQLIDTETGDRTADVIESRLDADLLLAIGFFDVLELGVVIPMTVHQATGDLTPLERPADDQLAGGLRDLRIVPKLQVASAADNLVSFALALPVSLPTGSAGDLLGSDGATFAPTLVFSIDSEYFDLAFNGGYRLRKQRSIGFSVAEPSIAVGSELFGSVGTKIAFVPEVVELVGDLFVSTSVKEQDVEETPLESLFGLRVHIRPGIVLNAAAGPGLSRGLGAPAYRVLFGVGYEYSKDPDPDHDRILEDADACPEIPEDFDRFEDADGCPEADNDKDGVLDVDDRCPLEPEDKDGFQDEDGCPDPDNDKDGILDPGDRCPNEAEDKDNFEDAEGCPDPDNDKDGILDPNDRCPNEPEDRDGFEDEDGCPDPDNDKDGILDPSDRCPNEPETLNGNQDEDGCPDQAKGPVQIEHGKITTPPVFFAINKDVILPQSFPILEQVAATFRDNPWVKHVRIEGHTDSRGNDAFNLDLSQRRAESVRRFLLERGVDPARVETAGYGETRPVSPNETAEGRAANRRVEFIILDPPQAQQSP